MPRVTVIIATYNWSSVLPFSIGSVLRQTFRDFELLVIGDGCTDDSAAVVGTIPDSRVRWANLPVNTRHQSGPNNEGLRIAEGEIIAYLGHDDLWLPHHLGAMVNALDTTGSDLAYGLCMNVAPSGLFWPEIPRPQAGSFSPPSCMTHRRSVTTAIGGWRNYHDVAKISPDVELWRRAAAAGLRFTFVPRLSAIKFPASWRRNVYRQRPCAEQAAWSARLEAEPDFEARQLVQMITSTTAPPALGYRGIIRSLLIETVTRIRRRASLPNFGVGNSFRSIDRLRRYKGL